MPDLVEKLDSKEEVEFYDDERYEPESELQYDLFIDKFSFYFT